MMNQAPHGHTSAEPLPIDILLNGVRNVFAHKYKIALISIVAGVGAYYAAGFIAPKFASTVTISVEGTVTGRAGWEDSTGPTMLDKSFLYTQFEILTSRDLAELIATETDAPPVCTATEEQIATHGPTQAFAYDLMRSIEVVPVRNTSLFRIKATCNDPEVAKMVAELYADGYKQFQYGDFRSEKSETTGWMNEQMNTLREALSQSEKELQEYKEKEAVYSSRLDEAVGNVEVESLLSAFSAEKERQAQLTAVHQQIRQLGEYYDIDDLTAISRIREDRIVSQLLAELSEITANYNQLKQTYMDDHPSLQDERVRYNEKMRQLRSQVDMVAKSIAQQLAASRSAVANLEAQLKASKTESISQDRQRAVLAQLEQNVEVNRGLLRSFMERVTELTHAQGFVGTPIKVVNRAYVSRTPVSPNKKLFAVLGFGSVFSLLSGFFMIRGLQDTTVKAPAEVELKLSALLLGYLPRVKTNRSDLAYNGYLESSNGVFSEAVRSIRTSLTLLGMNQPHKITVVTSSVQNEGKSTVALNLASSIGRLEKTLLIDADVRRPTMAKSLGFPESATGFINAISDGIELTECIYPGQPGNCDFMPTGRASALFYNDANSPGSPLELLSSAKCRDLLNTLSEHYDHIIIDAAPVCGVSDTKVLCANATQVVYVVAAHETDSRLVKQGIRELEQAQVKVAGVVLNNVDMKKLQSYGYGGYYSSAQALEHTRSLA